MAQQQFTFSKRKLVFYLITLAAIIVVYTQIDELTVIKDIFVSANGLWLFAAAGAQFLSYVFLALNYQNVLRIKNLKVSYRELFPITFIVQFINQALPSANVSGQAFFISYLRIYGLSVMEGIGRAILELTTLYIAFGFFFILTAAAMFADGEVTKHPEFLIFVYIFIFFAVLMLYTWFTVQKPGSGRLIRWIARKAEQYLEKLKFIPLNGSHFEHLAALIEQFKTTLNFRSLQRRAFVFWRAFFWQVLSLAAGIFVFYFVALAIGTPITMKAALVVFTLSKFVWMLSIIPGGLGLVEVTSTLVLVALGVPTGPAAAITLLARAFNFWLPMPIGWLWYGKYSQRFKEADKTATI